MTSPALKLACIGLVLVGCAGSTADPSPPIRGPLTITNLPPTGLVVESGDGVSFLDLSGKVLTRFAGGELAGNAGAPRIWLKLRKSYHWLNLERGSLVPLDEAVAKQRMYDEGVEPRLPPPSGARVAGEVHGRWRYAFRSSDGDVLAQWSGECEVPTAFWIRPGSPPQAVTGEESLGEAPPSVALGWSEDGRAFVFVSDAACGAGGKRSGIYSFAAPGRGKLVYTSPGLVAAEMWSS